MKLKNKTLKAKSIFFNIHIPKCAGSSFVAILKKNFYPYFGDGRSYLSDASFKYTKEQITEILTHFPQLQCFSDHKLTIDLPFDNHKFDVQTIAFVRNPISRFLSHYFYCRHDPINNFDPLAKKLDLENYVDEVLFREKRQGLYNGQTYHLTGINTDKYLEQVKNLTNNHKLLLFQVEYFDESCVFLEKLYPDYFSNCTYIPQNISQKDQVLTQSLQEKIQAEMSLDYQLLELSKQQRLKLSKYLFSSEEEKKTEVDKFKNRCDRLKRTFESPKRKFRLSMLNLCKKLLDDPFIVKVFKE